MKAFLWLTGPLIIFQVLFYKYAVDFLISILFCLNALINICFSLQQSFFESSINLIYPLKLHLINFIKTEIATFH
jgi:hypothetical protein